MTWPTVSKGVFYSGYNKGMKESKSPSERSMQTVSAPSNKQEDAKGRMVYPASNPMTAESMRKPK